MNYNRSCRGFTLIETLIAVSILVLAISGPLFTANRALVASEVAQGQLTASYLAQEGIEYARWMRDDAYLNAYKIDGGSAAASTDGWNDFLTGSSAWSITQCESNVCTLDATQGMSSGALQTCPTSSTGPACAPLYLQTVKPYAYTQANVGTKTMYVRTLQATKVSSNEEKIASVVTWDFHGTKYTITLTDNLTPWQ